MRGYLPPVLLVLGVAALGGLRSTPATGANGLHNINQVKVGSSLTGGGTGPTVSLDIGPGAIKNDRIQDGTLQIQKLSTAARAALKGDPGPQGLPGAAGPG